MVEKRSKTSTPGPVHEGGRLLKQFRFWNEVTITQLMVAGLSAGDFIGAGGSIGGFCSRLELLPNGWVEAEIRADEAPEAPVTHTLLFSAGWGEVLR